MKRKQARMKNTQQRQIIVETFEKMKHQNKLKQVPSLTFICLGRRGQEERGATQAGAGPLVLAVSHLAVAFG